ncbi:hypothetical protein HYX06_00090 [Candidatus Woesearchaeota archaeon]|nr:hypothetical protein [Candidatus Woesearchaeota archaeon]
MTKIKIIAIQMFLVIVLISTVSADGSSDQSGLSTPGVSEPIEPIIPPDLSNYPDMFVKNGNFNAAIVVGNQAPASDVIAQSNLASSFVFYLGKNLVGFAKLSSEIDDLSQNIISIGSACHNPISAQIIGYPKQCDIWLEPGKAMIILYRYKDYVHMVIAGYSDKGTRDAVDFLINKKKGSLSGNNLLIDIDEPKPTNNEPKAEEKTSETKQEEDSIDIEKEKEKLIEELNEKIANKPEDSSKKAINPPATSQNISSEQKQAIKSGQKEQKKETGIIDNILNWFKQLFS